MARLRGWYLFDLAAICHCPPPVVDRLGLTDFARLIHGLDQMNEQTRGVTAGGQR